MKLFEEAVEELRKSGYFSIEDNSIVHLTEKGRDHVSTLPVYHFNGWDYRGKEMIFFARLSLVVQTVSNFKSGEKSFMPIQKDYEIQLFVKTLLHKQPISDTLFITSNHGGTSSVY